MIVNREEVISWILWQDQDLMIINKPAGLLCIQDGYDDSLPNIRALFSDYFGQIWLVHRLDKETSGILILAKNASTHRHLNQQFELRQIKKEYHAILNSIPDWREKTVAVPLLVNGDRKHRTVRQDLKGKAAKTKFKVLSTGNAHALIAAFPHSGYRHQIRAHLREIRLSILQDKLYTVSGSNINAEFQFPMNRMALHAFKISFVHPSTDKTFSFDAPYPVDLLNTMHHLGLSPGA